MLKGSKVNDLDRRTLKPRVTVSEKGVVHITTRRKDSKV
jgi:hypothetical protein